MGNDNSLIFFARPPLSSKTTDPASQKRRTTAAHDKYSGNEISMKAGTGVGAFVGSEARKKKSALD